MMRNPSVMEHNFSSIQAPDLPRSQFNRSHGLKTTFDAGKLIPIFLDEALPGDTFNLRMSGFGRLATPIHPIMDNMYLDTHFFAVPMRLVWDNWQKFCGEQKKPGDSTDFVIPHRTGAITIQEGSLLDYFGLPTGVPLKDFSVLPFRAYHLIFNEWYRDQNLVEPMTVITDDSQSVDASGNWTAVRRRAKRHDYFTSCLPWPQKGDAVQFGLGGLAPIGLADSTFGHLETSIDGFTPGLWDNTPFAVKMQTSNVSAPDLVVLDSSGSVPPEEAVSFMATDLSQATAVTVNELREAFQVQKILEKDARGGTRYVEILKSHFGVDSDDARLQRPEYLGGGTQYVNVSQVPQMSETTANSPQGNMSAFGTVGFNDHGFTKSFTEHCLIIGIASVRADLTYQQGINRMWSRSTRFDFYWPSLAHLGEQAVLNKEIYATGLEEGDNNVFGYQERWAEYRYKPSLITGGMRSNASSSYDTWHLSQDFASLPKLNQAFIEENPPLDRVIAVPSEPHFIFDAYFDLKCARPMPTYSVPGMIDHF